VPTKTQTKTKTKTTGGADATATVAGPGGHAACSVPANLERALLRVARSIFRLRVPEHALAEGEVVDRAGYWLMIRVSEQSPIRLSELADAVELDLSTVSRQMSDLVSKGLVTKVPDPHDGRASLLSLSDRGAAVLESVSEARRQVLAEVTADWSEEERTALAVGLVRLAAGLQATKEGSS
jgi:DNA-binding MarR family transcriptional regulator